MISGMSITCSKMEPQIVSLELHTGRKRKPIKYYEDKNDCFICVSHSCDVDGYPKIVVKNKWQHISRLMFKLFVDEELKETEVIRHQCHNPKCINPNHLMKGTQKQNIQDSVKVNRMSHGENHYDSRLTKIQVRKIRRDKRSHRVIAKDYGVAHSTIGRIKRRKIWRRV